MNEDECMKLELCKNLHNRILIIGIDGVPNIFRSRSTFFFWVKITILRNTESPFKNTPSWIKIKPGLGLKLSVEKKLFRQFNHWPYLYSDCLVNEDSSLVKPLDDMTLFEKVTENNFAYSKDTCLLHCFNFFMSQVCNCSAYWIRWRVQEFEFCFDKKMICEEVFYYHKFNVGRFIEDNCNRCPLECYIHRFDN